MNISEMYHDYMDYIVHVRNYSFHTIRCYKRDLSCYVTFFSESELCYKSHVKYLEYLRSLNLSRNTIRRKIAAIKSFSMFIRRQYGFGIEGVDILQPPKTERKIPEYLTTTEVEKLLNKNLHNDDEVGNRNHAIMETLYSTGARAQEICDLLLNDVDHDEHYVRLKGKGLKSRIAPLTDSASKAIKVYLKVKTVESKYVFTTSTGKKMRREYIYTLVTRLAKKAKLSKSVSPHTFRHSFATHMMNNGTPIRVLQELMGHSHLSTTEVYLHVSMDKIKQSFGFHPKNRLSA